MRVAPTGVGSPSAADRAETDGSPGCGIVTDPPTAFLVYGRLSVPPAQRRPSPKSAGATDALPCRRMLVAVAISPEEVKCTVSQARLASPLATSSAPPVPAEFWQPWPEEPLFAHGQAAIVPSPGQKDTNDEGSPRSRTKMSVQPFVSLATRFQASLSKATTRPSAEIEEGLLDPLLKFPCAPPLAT